MNASGQHLVTVQASMEDSPLVAVSEIAGLSETIIQMVRSIEGSMETLGEVIDTGAARDEWSAVLFYLGAETCADALAAYDGSTPFSLDTGYETMLTVFPLPAPGQITHLWDGSAADSGLDAAS
jgi:hypothetical protein